MFSNATFSKVISGRKFVRVLNSSDPGHDQRSFGSDLGPNCLHKISADNYADFYQNLLFQKMSFSNTIRLSNCLDLDLD